MIEAKLLGKKDWKTHQQKGVRCTVDFEKHFNLHPDEKTVIDKLDQSTRIEITPYLLQLIKKDEKGYIVPNDPIWLQYGPSQLELNSKFIEKHTSWENPQEMFADGLTDDERKNTAKEKIAYVGQHKYPDKVVIRITHVCASYCRSCFVRDRTIDKGKKTANPKIAIPQAVEYITQHSQIREIIFTGGDPLMLSDDKLIQWIEPFSAIPSIESLRIHTRVPAQNPYRITPELINVLRRFNFEWMNIQINHPVEITHEFKEAIQLLQKAGIMIKRENPIIKNVNDKPEVLAELISQCRKIGVGGHHFFHLMPVAPEDMRTSVERMVLLFQATQKYLGNIRWNSSELGQPVISDASGKRTIPFEEIEIDLYKPREKWGTNKFIFTSNDIGIPIVKFTDWRPNSQNWHEYEDPHVDLTDFNKNDFIDLL